MKTKAYDNPLFVTSFHVTEVEGSADFTDHEVTIILNNSKIQILSFYGYVFSS